MCLLQAELVAAVMRRRGHDDDSDDEDMGLPASPVTHSPTAVDILMEHNIKVFTCFIITKFYRNTIGTFVVRLGNRRSSPKLLVFSSILLHRYS